MAIPSMIIIILCTCTSRGAGVRMGLKFCSVINLLNFHVCTMPCGMTFVSGVGLDDGLLVFVCQSFDIICYSNQVKRLTGDVGLIREAVRGKPLE